MRGDQQVVVTRMDLHVAHRRDREVTAQRDPVHAAIPRREHTRLGAHVEQVTVLRVLANHVRPPGAVRQVAANALPCFAVVRRHEDGGRVVVVLVMVGRDVCGAGIEVRCLDRGQPGVRLETRHVREHARPCPAAVAGDMHHAVVRRGPDHVRIERGRCDAEQRRMKFGRRVVHHDLAAGRNLLLRVVGREVRRDHVPTLAVVLRPEDHVAAEVHDARVLRRERDRCIPVEAVLVAQHRVTHRAHAVRVRVNRLLHAAARVGDVQHAALRVAVHQPRLVQHRHGEESVAA